MKLSGFSDELNTGWKNVTERFLFTAIGIILFFFFPPFAKLVIAMEELKQCRLQQRNISATVDKLMLCLPGEELEME